MNAIGNYWHRMMERFLADAHYGGVTETDLPDVHVTRVPESLNDPRYHVSSQAGEDLTIYHLDAVPWLDAPAPPHHHKCWTQTYGVKSDIFGPTSTIRRCPCGAIRMDSWNPYSRPGVWLERNSR